MTDTENTSGGDEPLLRYDANGPTVVLPWQDNRDAAEALYQRFQRAIKARAPFDWTELEPFNVAVLQRWEAEREAERAKRLQLVGEPGGDQLKTRARQRLRGVADLLAGTTEGRRESVLNWGCYTVLAPLVAAQLITRDQVYDAITPAAFNCRWAQDDLGGDQNRLHAKIDHGLDDGESQPIDWHGEYDWGTAQSADPPWKPPQDGDESDPTTWVERSIEIEVDKLRVRREAKRRLDAEERPVIEYPPVKSLATLLGEPDTPTRYRIESVAPEGGRVMLSAQYKAGKTTLVGNLLRSLADGDPFLGAFTVNTYAEHAVLIDNEMSENTLRRWLRAQNIDNTSAVADVISLRGKVSTFNLLDDQCRAESVTRLRDLGCDYLILDCLRPVLDALGLDENRDAGQFLVAFDALIAEAGICDTATVQHIGHANERARGDSRLQDWPNTIWRLVRETDEPDSPRFFSAYGRDVDVHEGRLSFDPNTRRLTYAEGSRRDAKTEAAQLAVIEFLTTAGEPLSKAAIERDLGGEHSQKAIRDGVAAAVKDRLVTVTDGRPTA